MRSQPLEQTLAGCDWLIDRFSDLWQRPDVDHFLLVSADAFHRRTASWVNTRSTWRTMSTWLDPFLADVRPPGTDQSSGAELSRFDWKK